MPSMIELSVDEIGSVSGGGGDATLFRYLFAADAGMAAAVGAAEYCAAAAAAGVTLPLAATMLPAVAVALAGGWVIGNMLLQFPPLTLLD